MRLGRLFVVLVILVALVAGACGDSGSGDGSDASGNGDDAGSSFNEPFTDVDAYPAVVSSEHVVGENRVLIALFDENDSPIGSPKVGMHVEFFELESSTTDPVSDADGRFVWSIKGQRGLWEFLDVELGAAGTWGARVTVDGSGLPEKPLKTSFEVVEEGSTPPLGSAAPASDTPTADDVKDLAEITSDDDPDPRFYETSIADAIADNEPFVAAFATPRYCASQVCGPTLDVVKRVAEDWPEVTFIHVEVFDLDNPSELEAVPAMTQWGLPSEPWVFVVDSKGKIAAKYEGTVSPRSLNAELDELR